MKALIFGAGGAGDVISCVLAMEYYRKLGYETLIGSIIWERYVIDPVPGPINFEELRNAVRINDCVFLLNTDTFANRAGNIVTPTLVKVIRSLNLQKGYALNNRLGPRHLANCIEGLVRKEGIDLVIGVDAGGDMMTRGDEETIMSPLIDAISLAALYILRQVGINAILGVIGCGSDGELGHDYFLKLVSEIARGGGLIDIKGYDLNTASKVKLILEDAESEASRIPLEAFFGLYGEVKIRKNTRNVFVTPASAVMFFLDPVKVFEMNKLAGLVLNASSLDEANMLLNRNSIYTEYDFEKDIFKAFGLNARNIDGETIRKIRTEGKRRLLF